jgi:hypothetical protein
MPMLLNSAKISSPLGNYVTIRRTRHSGRVHLRWARSGIQLKFNIISLFLDPGSRPALRDLAGMTNCDTVSCGDRPKKEAIKVKGFEAGAVTRPTV